MENINENEVIKEFIEFAKESNEYFGEEIERIKSDRNFASGGKGMWNKTDIANVGNERMLMSVPITDTQVNAIVNPFMISPYSIVVNPTDEDDTIKNIATPKIKSIESKSNSKSVFGNAIRDAVIAGYGYAYVTTDKDEIDESESLDIKILPILDATMIIPCPASKEIDGSDSEQMAVAEFIKIKKAKQMFGKDIINDNSDRYQPAISNFGAAWSTPTGCLALVTYFRRQRRNGKPYVEYFKMIGDKIIDSGELNCPFIPIVPFKGMPITRDDKKLNVGIIDRVKAPMKLLNASHMNIFERLARAPKPLYRTTKSAIEGNEEYIKNIDRNMNPVVILNDKDEKGDALTPTFERIDNTVQSQDLNSLISSNADLVSMITGMPLTGIAGGNVGINETAEGIIMKSRSSENNVSHYYENAKASIKHIGRILMYFLRQYDSELANFNMSKVEISLDDGPELVTQRNADLKMLMAYQQTLPEAIKPAVTSLIASNLDIRNKDQLIKNINTALPPEFKMVDEKAPVQEDHEAIKIMNEMSMQIDQFKQQLDMANNTIAQLQNTVLSLQEDSQAKILIAQMDNQTKLQIEAMKQDGANKRLGAELVADAEKDTVEMEAKLAETRMKRNELLSKYTPSYGKSFGINKI